MSEQWPVGVSICVVWTISQSYACKTQNKLKDHEELKHERVKYKCDKCDDAFTTQNKLKDHEVLKQKSEV